LTVSTDELSSGRTGPDEHLAVIADRTIPLAVRMKAFEQMLEQENGWWGRGTLLDFTRAVSLGRTRKWSSIYNLAPDALDWEGIAHEALLELFENAAKIHGHPRAWLVGVIGILIKREWTDRWPMLSGKEVPENATLLSQDDDSKELRGEEQEFIVRETILHLTPALKQVGELLYLEYCSRTEIKDKLQIREDVLRKRIERVRKALKAHLAFPTVAKRPSRS
jgi:DNA-directed RNA polymerase specialized sigma24 family protein